MKSKKIIAAVLSVSILSLSATSTFAANFDNVKPIPVAAQPVKADEQKPVAPYFAFFGGTVKAITDYSAVKGAKLINVVDSEGLEANILLSEDTYVFNNVKIEIGKKVTGYYKADAPMIMIYPAQYNAEVIVVEEKDLNVKVGVFNKDLISDDNGLKLHLSETTEIVLQDGTVYKGDLANRKLAVAYGISTKSIPAQTTPSKVVVLNEKKEVECLASDVSKMDILVNNKKVQAPAAYTNEKGVVMVPIRAISEALGFEVNWHGKTKSVTLDRNISLTIGKDYYTYMKMAPIQLGTAPELIKGRTFVPLSFFTEVARVQSAGIFEGQIKIENEMKK